MFQIKNNVLKISVRNLVEFLCQSGDIDNRFSGVSDKTAMEAGRKAHRKIQKSMGPEYRAEVPLKLEILGEEFNIIIDGRADGIFLDEDICYIDEIKGTGRELRYLTEANYVHKAQAMCYAYIFGKMENLDKVGIRNTYIHLETEEIRYFEEVLKYEEIEQWFNNLLAELKKWVDYIKEHSEVRDKSIRELEFPFEFRQGQRNLAVNVYKTVSMGKNFFIQAPTGVGKTISTVYPAVKSMGEGLTEKIFYLTAKTITRTAAEEAFNNLRNNGAVFSTATITAKEKICFQNEDGMVECNPVACPYAKGHYDRINDAVYDIITHESVISRQVIEEYAIKHKVCPFEFCLDITYWVDGIICDYNYVFDPRVHLKRFFAENDKREFVFLVDEAHNLVDRGRQMFSASILKEDILEIKKMLQGEGKRLANALEKCNKDLLQFKRNCDGQYIVLDDCDGFAYDMLRLGEELSFFMEKNKSFSNMKELSEFYFEVNHFNNIYEELDENYIIYAEHVSEGFEFKLFCVNPSKKIAARVENARNAVFFSATLLPINYYKELLSGDVNDYAVYADSVFDNSKRLLLIGRDVTSRYTRRNENEYRKVHEYILKTIRAKRGNYLVFFPSYKYMESVYATCQDDLEVEYVVQHNKMTELDKEEFLARFEENKDHKILVGMCVMGGVFSEGIDLKNDSLIGAIIVGTGLPSLDTRQELLKMFFDDKNGNGYDYAYTYPGMNKVLQAAGRVIRTEEDRGVVILLDDRFMTKRYLSLFPREWGNYGIVDVNSVQEEILDFWSKMFYNDV